MIAYIVYDIIDNLLKLIFNLSLKKEMSQYHIYKYTIVQIHVNFWKFWI